MDAQEAIPLILALDAGGLPVKWLPWQDVVALYCNDKIAWEAGSDNIRLRGGFNPLTGHQSEMFISTIVAVPDRTRRHQNGMVPRLNNRELFRRDRNLCMYCGEQFPSRELTRDHVVPLFQGGPDRWENVVTACRSCNHRKGARTPEQAHMKLLAVPYAPNHAEWLILANRRILADQMAFLSRLVPQQRRMS
ncbi:MAG TPA: HNH endonuclease [Gammaproteobacteria bacterium]|nr:HNH endonuclease [Gammaproteobacteria bacterium]